jgi:hypothetical protein
LLYFKRAGMKPTMFTRDRAKKRSVILLVTFLLMGSIIALTPLVQSIAARFINEEQRPQGRRAKKKTNRPVPRADYTRFSHHTHVAQQKLSCDSCHKFPTKNWKDARKGDAAFADVAEFPEHSSCLNCHRTQFFARERPAPAICSNCHVKVTPRDTKRFLFPSLGDVAESSKQKRDVIKEFAVNFPHDKHLDVVGLNSPVFRPADRAGFVTVAWQQKKESSEPKSCPVCHQTDKPQGNSDEEFVTKPPKNLGDAFWLKKGTFKTIPNSHAVCFTCHNSDVGIEPLPSNCNACHKLAAQISVKTDFDPKLAETIGVSDKTVLTEWNRRISSGTFRHEGGEHPNLSCMGCHDVLKMNTTDAKTLIVPTRSCGGAEGCHITATTDDGGILNYEIDQKKKNASFVCTKCHITLGKETAPDTHVKTIQALKKP